MPTLAEVLSQKIDRLIRRMDRMSGVFEVATVSPLTVYLNGDTSAAVPGVEVEGCTYTVGTKGMYFLNQGQEPWCWTRAT